MAETTQHVRDHLRGPLAQGGAWFLLCILALAALAGFERNARLSELTTESERLHAVASQRADQHDAHLTALSAIAVAGADQRPDLFREVAGAIMRFYPRIVGISLVSLDGEGSALEIGIKEAELGDVIRAAARRSTGAPVLVRYPSARPAYLIVKRSPNSQAARYGLALIVDAAALLDGDPATGRMLRRRAGWPFPMAHRYSVSLMTGALQTSAVRCQAAPSRLS
ncbi:hypothetical protein [Sulfitobacter sediminilitoris]|uniref:hypothetical protein n=1 Tax=Sulfitobacter sediminilitoris TaxID=2698830 RepID=UPI003624089E